MDQNGQNNDPVTPGAPAPTDPMATQTPDPAVTPADPMGAPTPAVDQVPAMPEAPTAPAAEQGVPAQPVADQAGEPQTVDNPETQPGI